MYVYNLSNNSKLDQKYYCSKFDINFVMLILPWCLYREMVPLVTGRFAQKPVPPWDDSTGTIRAKNRTGRFAQKNWDDSLKIKFRSRSIHPFLLIYLYNKYFALQMSMIPVSLLACECGKRFITVPHFC